MRIELFQSLYERYSRLALSFPSDRPIAIKGLEARLLSTFSTTGGFGIFDIYLYRCLLWQRDSEPLKRIGPGVRGGSQVPSWSWMGYDGAIRYLAVPFAQALWSDDITSPFAKSGPSESHYEKGITAGTLELKAPVWEITTAQQGGELILDDPSRPPLYPIYCVVMGKSKAEPRSYYVLLVHAANNDEDVYERVGVGILDGRHIVLNGAYRMARIR